jgi:signal transduction histidine kinase
VSPSSALDRPIRLAELVEPAALEELLKTCAEFHAVGLTVTDLDGEVLVQAGTPAELCEAVRERASGASRCAAKLTEVRTLRTSGPAPVRCDCFTGLRYQVAPVVLDGTRLGSILFGPYLPEGRPASLPGVLMSILGPSGLGEGEAALARLRPFGDHEARRAVEHVGRSVSVLLHTAYARHLTAQIHSASIAETYKELSEKNLRLAAAVERMQEVDRLKSNFLATVSHELRTPLTSIIGYSEMLIEGLAGVLNTEQREYVQVIMEKGDQLLSLITGLLDVSRMDSGPLRLQREPLALTELVGGIMTAMAPLARRKRVELRFECPPELPRVDGDRDKLRQVLFNLVGNALKFTPDGGRVLVAVGVGPLGRDDDLAARPGLGLRLRVADSGIGIAPESQVRIFEPFYQVDSSSTREYGGTGLGLTLVKSYVEAHGGSVWVDSELGRGSAFTVTLPAVADDLASYAAARAGLG